MANKDLYVPDEILTNILVRVPRKSLSRFRCVSKHWNRLILDPDFIKSRSCEKIFLPDQVIDKFVNGEYRMVMAPFPFEYERVAVGGTFNGIVLLVLTKNPKSRHKKVDMILYNPLTRVYKKVPDPPPLVSSKNRKYPVSAVGFGHGATQDDLKIVTLAGVYNGRIDSRSLSCNVFSLKNKSWSTMSGEPQRHYSEFCTYAGTFLNGFLYWIIKVSEKLILALDVKKMMFSEIKFSNDIAFDILGTIKGRLCLITGNMYRYPAYSLLVMNKEGFWESHFKSCLPSLHRRPYYKEIHSMCIFDEGKIIMKNYKTNKLIIFDLLNDSYEQDVFESTDVSQVWTTQAIEYEESRVSPSDLMF